MCEFIDRDSAMLSGYPPYTKFMDEFIRGKEGMYSLSPSNKFQVATAKAHMQILHTEEC